MKDVTNVYLPSGLEVNPAIVESAFPAWFREVVIRGMAESREADWERWQLTQAQRDFLPKWAEGYARYNGGTVDKWHMIALGGTARKLNTDPATLIRTFDANPEKAQALFDRNMTL